MKRFIGLLTFFLIFMTGIAIYACEMNFTLTHPDGTSTTISPVAPVPLLIANTYSLKVEFVEDHKRCITPPEETVYLLEEEKWKTAKDYLPLKLISKDDWIATDDNTWIQEIKFEAIEKGDWNLEVLRECPKGGYDEIITFKIK